MADQFSQTQATQQTTPPPLPRLVRYFKDTLSAGAQKIYEVGACDNLFLYSNTGAAATLLASFDQQQFSTLIAGIVIRAGGTFYQLVIKNNDVGSSTFEIFVSNGDIDFKGLSISSNVNIQPVQNASGTYAGVVTTGAAAKVFTGISNLAIILQADPGNGAPVFIGFDNTVSDTKYVIALPPGGVYVFNNYKGDLYAFSAAAQKLAVSYM